MGRFASYVLDMGCDYSGLGRWSWILVGYEEKKTRIMVAYQSSALKNKNIKGSSVWSWREVFQILWGWEVARDNLLRTIGVTTEGLAPVGRKDSPMWGVYWTLLWRVAGAKSRSRRHPYVWYLLSDNQWKIPSNSYNQQPAYCHSVCNGRSIFHHCRNLANVWRS